MRFIIIFSLLFLLSVSTNISFGNNLPVKVVVSNMLKTTVGQRAVALVLGRPVIDVLEMTPERVVELAYNVPVERYEELILDLSKVYSEESISVLVMMRKKGKKKKKSKVLDDRDIEERTPYDESASKDKIAAQDVINPPGKIGEYEDMSSGYSGSDEGSGYGALFRVRNALIKFYEKLLRGSAELDYNLEPVLP